MMKRRKLEHNPGLHIWKLAKHNPEHNPGDWFSEDILIEIFLWLPLNSLVRFKRLSKRWYFLITDRDNSYFRRNYLSTLSTRRRRNRIVGGSDDDSAIMAGFFYQNPPKYWTIYDRVRFIPTTTTTTTTASTSTQLIEKYSFLPDSQGGESTTTTTTANNNNTNINPFLSFDESFDKFLSCCLHLNRDPTVLQKKSFVVASSNGFLLLTVECSLFVSYYLLNPVTMEWLALPKRKETDSFLYVGFVCKGDYPSLDFVEYTIVRFSRVKEDVSILFELFSSGDNEWSEYKVSCESLGKFYLTGQHNTVIVSTTTTTTTNKQGAGGGGGIVVYFLVKVRPPTLDTAIVVFDLNKGDNSLQMIETPGPNPGRSFLECADYISEFDDGIHYVRLFRSTNFEFWVLNTESGEWYLKHRANLERMEGFPWMDIHKWIIACVGFQKGREGRKEGRVRYHIHAFHPMNPNLIFLTLYGRVVCYNVETGMLELVYDFTTQQNMNDVYYHYVYQWPCWPPLL